METGVIDGKALARLTFLDKPNGDAVQLRHLTARLVELLMRTCERARVDGQLTPPRLPPQLDTHVQPATKTAAVIVGAALV